MPLELTTLLSPLQSLLNVFQKERHYYEQSERYDEKQRKEAFQAIYLALTETRKYLKDNCEKPDRDRELELSKLWATSAIKSRRFCDDMVCPSSNKAMYWASELKWPHEIVLDKGIDLESIEAKIKQLIEEA